MPFKARQRGARDLPDGRNGTSVLCTTGPAVAPSPSDTAETVRCDSRMATIERGGGTADVSLAQVGHVLHTPGNARGGRGKPTIRTTHTTLLAGPVTATEVRPIRARPGRSQALR